MSEKPSSTQHTDSPNWGQIALSIMGWAELTVSVITFILDIYVAAIAFGIAALFLTLVAIQVKQQRIDHLRRRVGGAQKDDKQSPERDTLFWAQAGAGAALIAAAGVFAVLGMFDFTATFAVWGMTLGLIAHRASLPGS